MGIENVLLITLMVAGTAFLSVGVWTLVRVAAAATSLERLSEDLRTRLIPLAEKIDVTVDAVNAELYRVDLLLDRFEDASDRFVSASDTVSDLVSVPERLAEGLADRVRLWNRRRQEHVEERRAAQRAASSDNQPD